MALKKRKYLKVGEKIAPTQYNSFSPVLLELAWKHLWIIKELCEERKSAKGCTPPPWDLVIANKKHYVTCWHSQSSSI